MTASDILECIAAAGGRLSLTQIVESSGIPLTTIHRMLQALAHHGYISQDPDSRLYSLGPGLIHLGGTSGRVLGSWSRPWLKKLVDATGESATLAVLDGPEIIYVAQVPSTHNLRMLTELGRHIPAAGTAAGKAMLARLSDDDVRAILEPYSTPQLTERTITDTEALLGELEVIRSRGYAIEDGEQEPGVRAFAMVVENERPMAVTVSGPDIRLSLPVKEEFIAVLREVTAELAARPEE